MAYINKAFLVSPSSTFPVENIDAHFINRCNHYQSLALDDYVMGDLYDAPRNRVIRYFSDHTAASHGMSVQMIIIVDGSVTNDSNLNDENPLIDPCECKIMDLSLTDEEVVLLRTKIQQCKDTIQMASTTTTVGSSSYADRDNEEV